MKLLIGTIFGAFFVWLCATTDFVDNAVIFFLAGAVPGTDISVPPEVMNAIFMGLLGLVFLWILVHFMGYPTRQEVEAASRRAKLTIATREQEHAALEAAQLALSRHEAAVDTAATQHKHAKRRFTIPAITLKIPAIPASAFGWWAKLRAVLRKNVQAWAAQSMTYAKRLRAICKRALTLMYEWLTRVYAFIKPHGVRLWRKFTHEARYAAKGTYLATRGRLLTIKHSITTHSEIRKFFGLLRDRWRQIANR